MIAAPEPQTLLAGSLLALAFVALGLGPALLVIAWARLPARFLGPLAAASSVLVAYAVFWIAAFRHDLRTPAVAAAFVASAVIALWRRQRAWHLVRTDAAWVLPCSATLVAVAYLGLLFATGVGPNRRFAWELPADNILPALFAQRVVDGAALEASPPPLWPDGEQASDRPPLQAALVVALGPFMRGWVEPEYQIVATIAQVQWVQVLLLLGAVCGVTRQRMVVVLAACVLTGFFFVNSVFAWPKLLSAWLFLLALATLLETTRANKRDAWRRVTVAGGLVALSLLAHPGALFSVLALPLLLRGREYRAWLDPAGLAGAAALWLLLLAPWFLYQQHVDPPANRVARIHLAGDHTAPRRGVLTAMREAYAATPLRAHVLHRAQNVAAQFWSHDVYHGFRIRIQQLQFFHHVPSLGVLVIGLALVVGRRPPPGERHTRRLAGLALATLLLWIAVMFEGRAAVVHHGSYANTSLLFFLGAAGLTRLPWRWMLGLVGVHAALFVVVWAPAFAVTGNTGVDWLTAVAAMAAFGTALLLAGRTTRFDSRADSGDDVACS